MSAFEKLKSRTEWQAFLVMIVTTFAAFFFGIDLEPEQFERMFDTLSLAWGGTASYAVSRGIGKIGKSEGHVAAAAADAPAPAPSSVPTEDSGDQGAGSEAEDST